MEKRLLSSQHIRVEGGGEIVAPQEGEESPAAEPPEAVVPHQVSLYRSRHQAPELRLFLFI